MQGVILAGLQNGQAAARALLAACQGLCTRPSAFKVFLGQAVQDISTDGSSGHVESITTNEHRQAVSSKMAILGASVTPAVQLDNTAGM